MKSRLPLIDVGRGRHFGALTVFPVWTDAPSVTGVDWSGDHLSAGELPQGASVGSLEVTNRSSRLGMVLEGDLIVGGLQHRMAVTGHVLAPASSDRVDVACVEHGRWSGAAAHRLAGRRASLSVRHGNLTHRGGGAQSEVWRRIERYDIERGRSVTSSLLDHLDQRTATPRASERLRQMPGQRGVVIGIAGRIIGAEIFASSRGLAARWAGILDAAEMDAQGMPPIATLSGRARAFVGALESATLDCGEAAGAGRAIRFERGPLRIAGLGAPQVTAMPLHIAAFDDSHPVLELA